MTWNMFFKTLFWTQVPLRLEETPFLTSHHSPRPQRSVKNHVTFLVVKILRNLQTSKIPSFFKDVETLRQEIWKKLMYGRNWCMEDKICLTKNLFFFQSDFFPIKRRAVFLMLRSGSIFKGSTYLCANGGQCLMKFTRTSIDMSNVGSASRASILGGLPGTPLGLVSVWTPSRGATSLDCHSYNMKMIPQFNGCFWFPLIGGR